MTCYACDCNRFNDVDPYKCPNGVPAFLHNLNGEDARKIYHKIRKKCEFRVDKACKKQEVGCAHWICPLAQEDLDKPI